MLNKFKFSCLTDILEDEAINGYYNFDIDDEKEYWIQNQSISDFESCNDAKDDSNDHISELDNNEKSDRPKSKEKFTIINQEFDFPSDKVDESSRLRVFSNFEEEDSEVKNSKIILRIGTHLFRYDTFGISKRLLLCLCLKS